MAACQSAFVSSSFDRHQFIAARAHADLLAVLERLFPMDVRVVVEEVVVVMMPVRFREIVRELAVRQRRRLEASVSTGLVECDGVKRGEHALVRQDRRIVLATAVAVRRDVAHDVDVEARAVLYDGLCVLRHLAVEQITSIPLLVADGIVRAGADAAAAALAEVFMDHSLVVLVGDGIRAALLCALAATAAEFFVDDALARRMLLHLASAAAAAHADVLDGAAKARRLMTLEMREADEDVGIHDGAADLGLLDVLAVLDRHLDIIRAAQAVADDDLAACRHRVEAVEVRAVHVLERVFAAARIECVAVRQEGHAALLFDEVRDDLRVLRAKIRHVAELTEVHLDRDELAVHVNLLDASSEAECPELLHDIAADRHAEIREINFCLVHDYPPERPGRHKIHIKRRLCASRFYCLI